MYHNPAHDPVCKLTEKELQEGFDAVYEDLYCELAKFGHLLELHVNNLTKFRFISLTCVLQVCDNVGDHLIGNVYARYEWETEAQAAVDNLNERWYAGKFWICCDSLYTWLTCLLFQGDHFTPSYHQLPISARHVADKMRMASAIVVDSAISCIYDLHRKSLYHLCAMVKRWREDCILHRLLEAEDGSPQNAKAVADGALVLHARVVTMVRTGGQGSDVLFYRLWFCQRPYVLSKKILW